MFKLNPDIPNTDVAAGDENFGSAKDDGFAGDNTGTPLIEKWLNDLYYAFYAVCFKNGITPSGNQENTATSDFFDALEAMMNTHQSANFFNPTPQNTPNNTVKLSRAVVRDPNDPTSEPIVVPAGAADGLPVTGVTAGDTRRDRFFWDKTGAVIKVVGTPQTLPTPSTPPAIPAGFGPICQVLISTDGSPVLNNVADIIIDERIINRLQRSTAVPSKAVQASRVISAGNGVQTISHGLNSAPTKLEFKISYDQINGASSSGTCIHNGVTFEQGCNMFESAASAGKAFVKLGSVIHVQTNGGADTYTGVITDIDDDDAFITWTGAGGAVPGQLDFIMISSIG